LREKNMTSSDIDDIPGIGKKKKAQLLRHFNGINDIANATVEDLNQTPGITRALAEVVFSYFRSV